MIHQNFEVATFILTRSEMNMQARFFQGLQLQYPVTLYLALIGSIPAKSVHEELQSHLQLEYFKVISFISCRLFYFLIFFINLYQ